MRRLLCALLLAATATACGGAGAEPTPTPTSTPPASPRVSVAPSPSPSPVVVAPLTGMPTEDLGALERPVLAVKIDNARPALPQLGLEAADVVIEELVEGGATRFIALYNSEDPGTVGPVRSGREVDAELLPAFQPVLGISGAADPTYTVLRGAGLRIYEEGQAGGAFFRESSRRAPYNLFATAEQLWATASDLPAAASPWLIRRARPVGGDQATSVRMTFSPSARVTWAWDDDDERWLRNQGRSEHLAASGEQLSASNVVVARVPVSAGDGVDVAGSLTHRIDVIGDGEALILRNGRAFPARWRKSAPDAQFEWFDAEGRPLALAPGTTWIELLPSHAALEVSHAIDEPAGDGDDRLEQPGDAR